MKTDKTKLKVERATKQTYTPTHAVGIFKPLKGSVHGHHSMSVTHATMTLYRTIKIGYFHYRRNKKFETVQWKKTRTWDVIGNNCINHLSSSQLGAVRRLWVICLSVKRVLYGYAVLVDRYGGRQSTKTSGGHFVMKAVTFSSWDKIHMYKHISDCK